MDRRDANIDLVFRNGLKDYEVLPPSDVFESVFTHSDKKRSYFPILKYAASVLIIASASFLTYRLGLNQSDDTAPASILIAEQITLERHALRETPEAVRVPVLNKETYILENNSEGQIANSYQNQLIYSSSDSNTRSTSDELSDYYENPGESDPSPAYARLLLYDDYNSLAESSAKANGVKERWSVSALISPTFVSSFSSGGSEVARQIAAEDKPAMSYTGGVGFSYQISKRLSFQSGFYYSALGQNLSGVSAYGGFTRYDMTKGDHNFEVLTGSGTIYTSNSDVFLTDRNNPARIITRYDADVFDPQKAELALVNNSIKQSFSYLELPMIIRYKIVDKRVDINVSGGIS